MKKLFLLATCMVLTTLTHAQPTTGLVAHWPFNSNTSDISGNGHNGTPNNITYTAGIAGNPGTAAVFNGTSSYITVGYKPDLNLNKYTIAAIIKPMGYYSGICQVNAILWRGVQYTPSMYGLCFFDNPYDQSCYFADTANNVFSAFAGNNNGNGSQWQSAQKVVTNTWFKVIAVYQHDTIRMYVNGILASTYEVTSGPMGTSADSLFIGASYNGTTGNWPYWLNGVLDDLRIYNRALNDSEITHYGDYLTALPPAAICQDASFSVNYLTSAGMNGGNVFRTELSNSSGSFASPTIVGSITSAASSGVIACSTPALPPGNGYKIRVVSTNPVMYSDEATISLINPSSAPTATVSVSPGNIVAPGQTVVFTASLFNTSINLAYQWTKNGTAIAGATNASYSAVAGTDFVNNDNIAVNIFDSSTCGTQHTVVSNTVTMQLGTGIAGVENNYALNIYPNPSKGAFSIKGNFDNGNKLWLRVENSMGQLVSMLPVTAENNAIAIHLNTPLVNGLYTIKLFDQDKLYTAKLVIHQ